MLEDYRSRTENIFKYRAEISSTDANWARFPMHVNSRTRANKDVVAVRGDYNFIWINHLSLIVTAIWKSTFYLIIAHFSYWDFHRNFLLAWQKREREIKDIRQVRYWLRTLLALSITTYFFLLCEFISGGSRYAYDHFILFIFRYNRNLAIILLFHSAR